MYTHIRTHRTDRTVIKTASCYKSIKSNLWRKWKRQEFKKKSKYTLFGSEKRA